MRRKYIKPNSLTWWAFVSPLLAGIVLALSSVFPALQGAVTVINEASGGMSAPALINAGLAGIGIRGAMQ